MARRKLLVTGATGGMGRACARLLGASRDLVLSDISADALTAFSEELQGDGYAVSPLAGDLCDDAVLARLSEALSGGDPFDLIHTAGISPSMGDWREVMRVNWLGTEKLLRRIEPLLTRGSVAVLIASTAAHVAPAVPEIDAIMADPLADRFLDNFAQVIEPMAVHAGEAGTSGIAYAFSKRAVQRTAEARAPSWGAKGARIVTISPGTIMTPMGRLELQQAQVVEITKNAPLGRAATPMDIAFGARFLLSEEAGFITGSDLAIDGGVVGAGKGPFG